MKYTQIEDYLINRIKSKELIVGEQIEPDKVLAKKFDVSELTVNKALTNLANRGYLKRIKGRGTFVESYMGNDNSYYSLIAQGEKEALETNYNWILKAFKNIKV